MKNETFLEEIKNRIETLQQEKFRIDRELSVAQEYLKVLHGEDSVKSIDSYENIGSSTLDRMRKAQKARQMRERIWRISSIKDFLRDKEGVPLEEIAKYMKLSENTLKRYLRSDADFTEVGLGIWRYDEIPF